jgi:hypothetical protein
MVVVVLGMLAVAFGLYGFAAWSGATINCAPDAATAESCDGSRTAMWAFGWMTIVTILGAFFAWRKLSA